MPEKCYYISVCFWTGDVLEMKGDGKMSKLRFTKLLLLTVFISFISQVSLLHAANRRDTAERRTKQRRPQREDRQRINEATEDITFKLQAILTVVNSGEKLQQADIAVVKTTLANTKKYLLRFPEQSQCDYYLLSAWTNYYDSNHRMAFKDAEKAFEACPDNKDAQATKLAMAILNTDYRIISEFGEEKSSIFAEKKPVRQTRYRRSRGRRSSEILDISPEAIKPQLFGKEIPALQLNCLNGSTFSYTPGKSVLCILFWSLRINEDEYVSEQYRPAVLGVTEHRTTRKRTRRSDETSETFSAQMSAFAGLFLAEFENPGIRFLAVNTDSIDEKEQVIARLFKNSWPWAQVMAAEPSNTAIAEFQGLEINQPTLAIVGPDGSVCYAGQSSGFLPRIVLSHALSKIKPTPKAKKRHRQDSGAEDIGPSNTVEATYGKPKDIKSDTQTTQTAVGREEEFNPHAEELYNTAVGFKKGGRFTSRKMVDLCREILRQYPDTHYAEKARELLRELPDRYKKMYKITDEELGL